MLNGRLTIIVRLASLPKQDPLEMGWDAPSQPDEVDKVRIAVTFTDEPARKTDPSRIAALRHLRSFQELIVRRQGREWRDVVPIRWHRYLPQFAPLIGEFEEPIWPMDEIPLGDHHSAMYIVEAAVPDKLPTSAIEVRVFSPKRERVGRFPLFVWRK